MPSVALIDPTVIDPTPADFVSFNAYVNGQTFQRKGLLSSGGWQYTAWWNGDDHPVVARRQLGEASWETFTLDHSISEHDSHNVINLGIDGDGRIHVAMDCHVTLAYYTVSPPGLAGTGGPWDQWAPVVPLTDWGPITYPDLITTPEGLLQMVYRVGTSSNGALHLAEWDGTTWTRLGAFTTAAGTYSIQWPNNGPTKTSTARNLYVHGVQYDSSGRLHLAGVWRESDVVTSAGGLPNRDVVYVYSDDRGRTWFNSTGVLVATTGTVQLIGHNSPVVVGSPLPPFYGLMNSESMQVDSNGHPLVLLSYVPGRFTQNFPGGMVTDAGAQRPVYGRLVLARFDGSVWTRKEIKVGGADLPLGFYKRAQLVCLPNDDLLIVMCGGKIVTATAANNYNDWAVAFTGSGLNSTGEFCVDLNGSVLSVMYQQAAGLCVKDFEVS